MSYHLLIEPPYEGITEDELYHHGILGQKWGVRRFQPYRPGAKVKGGKEVGIATKVKQRVTGAVDGIKEHRAAKKKAAQVKKAQATRKANLDFQEAKRKAIESGSVDDLAKFKGKLSAEEYAYAFRRLDNERKLDQLVAANQPDPWEKVDKGFALVSRLAGYANTVSNAKESFDRLNKSKKDAAKEKKENAANDALTKVTNLDELNKVQKDHNLTPEQYAKGLSILGTKHQYEKLYGQDFWDTEARSRKEQEAKRKAEYDETKAKMDAEKAHKQSQKEARKAYKKDLNTPMDGEWWRKGGGYRGMKWGKRPASSSSRYGEVGTNKTNQLLLEMKDATPSKYGADKRSIKGAKPGTTSKARNTSALTFGDKTQLVKRGKSGESDQVRLMRTTVEATRLGLEAAGERKKKTLRHSALDMTTDELFHHGIKGQKWGVRRFQDKNGKRTKAGKDRVKYLRDRVKASRGGIVDDTWKTGSAALVARTDNDIEQLTKRYVGGVPHYASPSIVMRDFLRDTGDVPPDYKPMRGFTSFEEADLSYVNPDWGKPGTTQNCAKCAVATELMRYGVAVKAGRQAFPSSCDAMSYWFDGTEKVEKSLDDTEKLLASYGDGASGTIAGYYPNGAGGHAMHFSVSNGQVHVQDGQNGRHFGSIREAAETYGFDTNRNMHSFRLDTATPNWDHMAEDSVIGAPRWQSEDDRWRAKPTAPFRFSNNSDGTISNYDLTQESSNEIFRRHYT